MTTEPKKLKRFLFKFTTNIPDEKKEHTLDPKDLYYSDELNIKLKKTESKVTYWVDNLLNGDSLQFNNKAEVLNTLFNKKQFDNIPNASFSFDKKSSIHENAFVYISNIFNTYPKSNNIKRVSKMSKKHGPKFDPPFSGVPYNYIKINGSPYTVSRVILIDKEGKDKTNKNILEEYKKFAEWKNTNKALLEKKMKNEIIRVLGKDGKDNLKTLFFEGKGGEMPKSHEMLKEIQNELGNRKSNKETNIYKNLEIFKKDMEVINEEVANLNKLNLIQNDITKQIDGKKIDGKKIVAIYNSLNTIYTIMIELDLSHVSSALSKKLFSSYKFKAVIKVLKRFIDHYSLYDALNKEIYDPDLIDINIKNIPHFAPYIKFLMKIKKLYNPSDFDLKDLENKIKDKELTEVKDNSDFENEVVNLHIDLIKGEVNDENSKMVGCDYKDNDLVTRWDELMDIKYSDDDYTPLPFYNINEDKKKGKAKTGGKYTRKRKNRSKRYTRNKK